LQSFLRFVRCTD